VLSLGCPSKQDCTLASRSPADGSVRWTIGLSGPTRIKAGFNTKLLDLRDATSSYGDAQAAIARPMPRYLGFPLDGRVQIIDTQAGRRLREHETARDTRYVVAGNRVIGSRGTSRDGSCRYTVEARDAGSGTVVWRREGLDLRTASGAGCEPRRDPPGGGVVLVGTRGDNRAVLVSAVDGRELWVAGAGEKILTTDGEHALVRTADGRQVKAVALSNGGTAWTRDVPDDADVGLTSYATLITDAATKRLVALSTGSGRVLLDLETSAEVIGGSVSGLVLGNGRTVGYAAFSGAP